MSILRWVGGGGRVAAQIAGELARRGHQVRVQTSGAGELPSRQMIDGVDVRRSFSFRRKPDTCSVPEMLGYILSNIWPVWRAATTWHPDVMHVHFAVPSGPVAWVAHRMTGVPYVLTAHLGGSAGTDRPFVSLGQAFHLADLASCRRSHRGEFPRF